MDREYIKQHQLIERHLQGKLSGVEREALEERLMSSVDLLDEAEAAELLQQGLQDVFEVEAFQVAEKRAPWFTSLFYSPRFTMAVSVLMLISFGVSGILYQRNTQLPGSGISRALTTQIIPLVSVRGAPGGEPVNTLQLGEAAQQFV